MATPKKSKSLKPTKKRRSFKLPTKRVKGRLATKCYHCDLFLTAEQQPLHNCWTTTEETLTADLPEDLREAWERLRETAAEFGEQRIYASHKSIMFSKKSCYFFVRPKKAYLEVCFFAGRTIKDPSIQKVHPTSKTKFAHLVRVRHRDEVESPLTDWLKEAYSFCPSA